MNGIRKKRWAWCLLSVLLLSAGWYNITGLTLFVALVPLLLISYGYDSSRKSLWKMGGWAALTFGLWNIVCNWWVWFAAPIGVIASTIVQILLFGGVFMLYHYVSKRARPQIAYIVLVCGWIAMEFWYLTGELSFPWILLGNGFANDTWAVQWYSVTGSFGGALWVLLANVLIFRAIITKNVDIRRRRYIGAGILVVVPIIISLIMFWTYKAPVGEEVKITVVQPNIDSYVEKFTIPQERQNEIMLTEAIKAPADVDLIVFPETAMNDIIWEHDLFGSESVTSFQDFLKENYPNSQIIVGATTRYLYPNEENKSITARNRHGVWYDVYNSALAIDSTEIDIHHKNMLVIGVEKMPYMKLVKLFEGLIVDLGGTTGSLGRDGVIRVFEHEREGQATVLSSAPICYESVYGEHFANFAANGAQVMLVITNDGWWHDTPGYRQHFSFARLRAIETRRYIARSANTGISGFIDPRGDVRETLGWDVRGAITDTLILSDKVTFYAKYGDYIARICSFIFGLSILYFIAYTFRKKNKLVE